MLLPSCKCIKNVVCAIGLLAAVLLGSMGSASGQIVRGTFTGTVTDSSGAVVPGAKVTATNLATNVTTAVVSDASGNFVIPFLDPANYSVTAEQSGFKTAVVPSVKLDVAATVRVDLTLQVGQANQKIEVTAIAPLVQSDTSDVGVVVTSQELTQLPVLGRNYEALAQLSPTAVTPLGDNPVATYMGSTLSAGTYWQVAGQRGSYTNYTLDGIPTNNWAGFQSAGLLQSMDTIGEMKIQTHNFPAEYGRGTVQFTASTRSGTNTFHGSVYEYVRNNIFNANTYFANKGGLKKGNLRYNQFGATIGGPVSIPKIYNGKDKTFFFFGYEGTRYVTHSPSYARYADPSWLKGNFSDLTNPDGSQRLIYDPATTVSDGAGGYTRTPFPGNIIPSTRFDPVAVAALKYIPAAGSLTNIIPGENTAGVSSNTSPPNQYLVRIDHTFSSSDRIYGHYIQSQERDTVTSLAPLSGSINVDNGYNAMAAETHIFSPAIVNEFRFGFNRAAFGNYQEGGPFGCLTSCDPSTLSQAAFALSNIGGGPTTYGVPSFNWTGYSSVGGPGDDPFVANTDTYQASDDLSITKGRHSMKIGFDYGKVLLGYASETFSRGSFNFNGQYTQGLGAGLTNSGNPFADFLLGYANTALGLAGNAAGNFQTGYQGYYFQDDFRVNSHLTLNLGLRWEYYSPYSADGNITSRFDFGSIPGSCFGANCPPGHIEVLNSGQPEWKQNWNDWGPRIGFAYSPFNDNKTVIRAAYGIYYSPSDGTDNGTWGVLNPPVSLNFSLAPNNPYTDLSTTKLSNLFPGGQIPPISQLTTANWPLPPLSFYTEIGIEKDPTIHEWQLTIQRQLAQNTILEVGYLGSHGYHGQMRTDYNQARLDAPGQLTPITSRLPYPSLSSALFTAIHAANNSYEAGFVRVEKRFSAGISFVASYTYSKTIDDYGNLNGTEFWPQYAYNQSLEKGLSEFDVPHRFTAGYVWQVPFGHAQRFGSNINPVLNAVLGGWQLNGITTFQSGTPLNPHVISDTSNTGNILTGTIRPNIVGSIKYLDPRTTGFWFDPSAFQVPALGTLGDASRGLLFGPGINNWDLGIAKNFRLHERATLQLRGEMFNAFNHAQFQGVNVSISPSLQGVSGLVTSTRAPRNMQFAVRLQF